MGYEVPVEVGRDAHVFFYLCSGGMMPQVPMGYDMILCRDALQVGCSSSPRTCTMAASLTSVTRPRVSVTSTPIAVTPSKRADMCPLGCSSFT